VKLAQRGERFPEENINECTGSTSASAAKNNAFASFISSVALGLVSLGYSNGKHKNDGQDGHDHPNVVL
jgi:hypothetical protein